MRTEWVAPGNGDTVLSLFTFICEHGTHDQAVHISRIVLNDKDWFNRHKLDKTRLDLMAEPNMLVVAHDVTRAIDCLELPLWYVGGDSEENEK
jgi:hypothetical protein